MSATVSPQHDLAAWVGFLRSHAAITRQLNVDLQNAHGLTLNDYEVLVRLSHAEGQRMRRVDLAESVVLTASGITRLLDGLECSGFVEKAESESDARVSYARLTEAGAAKLDEAGATHRTGIDELFVGRYSHDELATLADLFSRLPMTGKACTGERACGQSPRTPVYWKPRYPTRVMRERAWAKRSLERERALKQAPRAGWRDVFRRLLRR